MDDEIHYRPYSSEVLPDGNLKVVAGWCSAEGERLDGYIIATPEHPNYALWLLQIENKDAYWAAYDAELKQAREERRQKSKSQKTMP